MEWGSTKAEAASPFDDENVQLAVPFRYNGITSTYHLFAQDIDYSRPVRLVVRLHGDGAEEFDEPDGRATCLADVANRNNAIFLEPRTPDAVDVSWWEDIPANMEWLGGLLEQEIYPKLGLGPADTVWLGYSGGAELLTYGILKEHPEWLGPTVIMISGGGSPESVAVEASEEQRANMDLTWVTGDQDDGRDDSFDALGQSTRGADFFRSQGFQHITEVYPMGYDHGNLPHPLILEQKLSGRDVRVPPLEINLTR